MKSSPLLPAVCALALLAVLPCAHAQISPVRVRVEQANKSSTEKYTKTQTRALKIFVSNSSKETVELKAKYVFFGRAAKGNDIVKLDEGEKPVSVKGLATEMVESGPATTTMEEEHSTSSGKGGGGKKVEASGHKFVGYGLQVYQGEKLVAESYDPPSGREQWSKASLVKPTAASEKK